jgi:PadR family transcriptional regulator, regulatory protein AphA
MTIQFAILGLLSWRSLSGYDLKKIISDSDLYPWSGNNNQIYRSLVEIHAAELVSQDVQIQESLPARKVYTITEKGRTALRAWVQSTPELPELHNTFLIQLAWADQLSSAELDAMTGKYAEEVEVQIRMLHEKRRRKADTPSRTPREAFLWEKISQNLLALYQGELDWVRSLQKELREKYLFNK